MCGVSLDTGFLNNSGKKLITLDELNVLKNRMVLFKARKSWLELTMAPKLKTLIDFTDEVKTLGDIDKLDASNAQSYFTKMGNALQDIKKELDTIASDDIWKGKTFPDGEVESNITLNTHFKPMVKPYTEAIKINSTYSALTLELEQRYNFILRKQIVISEYQRLRTYLTPQQVQSKGQSILNDSDITQLENDNNVRKGKLAQYRTKLNKDGNNKQDTELDTDLANSALSPVQPIPPVNTMPVNLTVNNNVFSQNTGPPKIHNVKLLSPFDQSKNLAAFNLSQELNSTPDAAYQNEIDAVNAQPVENRIKALTDNSNVNDIRGKGEVLSIQVNAIPDTDMTFGVSLQNNNGKIYLPNMVQISPKPLKLNEFKTRWGVSGVFYIDLSNVDRKYKSLKEVYYLLLNNINILTPKIQTFADDKMKVKDSSFEVTLDAISANGMQYLYAPSTETGTNGYKFVDDVLQAYDDGENLSNILKAVGLPVINFTTREELKIGLKEQLEKHVGGISIFKTIRREGNIDVVDFNVACKSNNELVCYRVDKTHSENISDLRKNGIAIFVDLIDLQTYNADIQAASSTNTNSGNALEEQDTDDEDIKTFKFTPTL